MEFETHKRLRHLEDRYRRQGWAIAALSILVCLSIAFQVFGQSPAEELSKALDDVEARPSTGARYLTLYNIPVDDRPGLVSVVAFVLNSISRSDVLLQPVRVNETLLRFEVGDVAPRLADRAAWETEWEELASADPYFHTRATVVVPATKSKKAVTKETFTHGGWVGLEQAEKLRGATGSSGAILRADYFLSRAVLPPRYYGFAGVPKTQDKFYEQRLGLDAVAVVRLRGVWGANLFRSRVTDKPRRLSRWPLPSGGSLWVTRDVARPTAGKDIFREPRQSEFKYDASEQIASLPNGLHVYALFSGAGARVDAVPAEIAIDHSPLTPVPVPLQPMLSCIRCHSAEGGLLSFSDQQSTLLAARIKLSADTPEVAQRLASFYGRQDRLARFLVRDREDYEESVRLAAIDADPKTIGQALSQAFLRYSREDVTPETALAELGIRSGEADPPSLQLRKRLVGTRDPLLMALMEGLPIQRAQWEVSFAEAALLAAGSGQPKPDDEPIPKRRQGP